MISASVPENEQQRLSELQSYGVLDTDSETLFDELTQLASEICETPIALISLVDQDRQWFKSKVGLDASETSRSIAFCSHAILQDDIFEICDATQDPRFHDNPLVTQDPNIRFYAGAPLVTPSGNKIGTLCAISDKPKTLTPLQKQTLATLSHSVIAHLELKRKNNELERTNQFRSDFLSYVSHEVRTPLNAINTFSRLLQSEAKAHSLPPSFNDGLGHINKSGQRLLDIVSSVLDLKQIEAGKMQILPRSVIARDVFSHLFALTRINAQENGVKFESHVDDNIPKIVSIDDTKFGQVAQNILSNAIKYTPKNKRVLAQVKYKDEKLIFTVKDEGIGISEAEQKRLFQPFERMGNAHNIEGTGLGLNISRRLVALMGGELKFKSKLHQGTTVTIAIDATAIMEINKVNAESTVDNDKLNITLNPTILVVEDHYINQMVIKSVFEALDIAINIVATGEDGIAFVNNNPVDLVLMDLNLPGISGLEATKRIKQQHGQKPIVIALTADALCDKKEIKKLGLDGFLTKPIDNNALIKTLNRYLPNT